MPLTTEIFAIVSEVFEKLAPFTLRANQVVVGRERLIQLRKRLAFVLMTTDMSERSRRELAAIFPCPQVLALTSEDLERIFGFRGTKLIGFRRGPLANAALRALREDVRPAQPEEPAL